VSGNRRSLLGWIAQGQVPEADVAAAVTAAGVAPDAAGWRQFLDRFLLWLGTLLLGAGAVFFFAYNWTALAHGTRFALAEVLVVAALLAVARSGTESAGGKAALFAASLFAGTLLALIGQTYQTGADTFELFASWALLILPWVIVARFAPLWMFWWLLVNLAVLLWFSVSPHVFGLLFGDAQAIWVLFAINGVALLAWEILSRHGVFWMTARWAPRLLALASGSCITLLALMDVTGRPADALHALLVWTVAIALVVWLYRYRLRDVFMLAASALAVIVVVATFLARHLASDSAVGYLLVGVLVVVMSAFAGRWLRAVAAEAAP
jgi:uncharacterized membrane protein